MRRPIRFIGRAVFVLVAIALFGAVVMLLWNAVIPAVIPAANPIDYLHAMGLLALCRILFGNFRGHGGGWRRRHFAKWEAMSPEEREQFMRCSPWGRRRAESGMRDGSI
jgi:hypothetical protein